MQLGPADAPAARSGDGADEALVELFGEHYRTLVRVAFLLVRDAGRAEELVQDAFVDLHGRWSRLEDPAAAAGYLRRSVVNRSRSALRHLSVVRAQDARTVLRDVVSAESSALEQIQSEEILACLGRLPQRQREVLVLRYYGQLREAEIASALGISAGSVKTHSSRGLKALRPLLGEQS
ncbi:RNA polymerase sigma factor [uncultured Friedmanniella sp.]|uniref:RNA polymerase sigma factor n=1 Tax=uncultured Friedmanniella sp. TaxID=335381 RepID=UPI0035CA54C8